jgi:2-polyprenyl-6-methoxyphenol hydroxylase-like FAD-dependent oxidoreductase
METNHESASGPLASASASVILTRVQRSITIAGGGLAGLTLGLLLRRQGVPVEIWDAGSYPRHRVCGEFINGRGVEVLRRLAIPGIPNPVGVQGNSVRFFYDGWSSPILSLPEPALSIDRATLDHALATEFRKAGGVLRENQRWTEPFGREGLVRATGRRPAGESEPQFVGFKAHARGIPLTADLELHFSDGAYVGLSKQRDGTVNVCGLYRKTKGFRYSDFRNGDVFRQVLSATSDCLARASFEAESFCAVAGISLKRETNCRTKECRIGDTICMIAPLTGNGMSIALESARLAAPVLAEYSRGGVDWPEAQARVSQLCDEHLHRRLLSASILQNAAFTSIGRRTMMYLVETFPRCFTFWFRLTR